MSADATNAGYRVALPEFEGPLDLLLHLCKTHELDIVHIPIAFITQKYLEYLEVMQSMSVDVAADYLVMAATLAYLKSRELVPAPEPLEVGGEEAEEEGDPREELIRRLLEYQKYKDAAEKLGARPIDGRNVFGRGMPIEMDDATRPLAEQSVWKLIESFGRLLEKSGKAIKTHNVVVDRVSIGVRINQLADRLQAGGGTFRFDACFDLQLPEAELRDQVVVTLLAILELAKLKIVRVLQSRDDETLFISQVPGTSLDVARRLTVTSEMSTVESPADDDAGLEAAAHAVEAALDDAVNESREESLDQLDQDVDEPFGESLDEAVAKAVLEEATAVEAALGETEALDEGLGDPMDESVDEAIAKTVSAASAVEASAEPDDEAVAKAVLEEATAVEAALGETEALDEGLDDPVDESVDEAIANIAKTVSAASAVEASAEPDVGEPGAGEPGRGEPRADVASPDHPSDESDPAQGDA